MGMGNNISLYKVKYKDIDVDVLTYFLVQSLGS